MKADELLKSLEAEYSELEDLLKSTPPGSQADPNPGSTYGQNDEGLRKGKKKLAKNNDEDEDDEDEDDEDEDDMDGLMKSDDEDEDDDMAELEKSLESIGNGDLFDEAEEQNLLDENGDAYVDATPLLAKSVAANRKMAKSLNARIAGLENLAKSQAQLILGMSKTIRQLAGAPVGSLGDPVLGGEMLKSKNYSGPAGSKNLFGFTPRQAKTVLLKSLTGDNKYKLSPTDIKAFEQMGKITPTVELVLKTEAGV